MTPNSWIKEGFSALLSLGIVLFTLWSMWQMFEQPADVTQVVWEHQSSILQIAVGLMGTVTGYYFGRIPAERAAATAQKAANDATAAGQQALDDNKRMRTLVGDLHQEVSPGTPLGGGESLTPELIEKRLARILGG
jgi:hypothetical protein